MGKGIVVPIEMVKASNCKMSNGGNVEDALNYSTTEHVVGKWIDGRTLYEKTISCGSLPNNTTASVNHNISNLEGVVGYEGVSYRSSDGFSLPIPSFTSVSAIVRVTINRTQITFMTTSDYSAYDNTYITLRYTKTS